MFSWLFRRLVRSFGATGQAPDPPTCTSIFDVSWSITDEFNVGDPGWERQGGRKMALDTRLYMVGDIKRFKAVDVTKNGSPWTLTSVTFYLVDPSGNVSTHTASQGSPTMWYFDTTASGSGSLDEPGVWRRYWKVSDGSNPNSYGDYTFTVKAIA